MVAGREGTHPRRATPRRPPSGAPDAGGGRAHPRHDPGRYRPSRTDWREPHGRDPRACARGNLEAFGDALIELDARLRGIDEDLPFVPDADALDRLDVLTLTTSAGALDIVVRQGGAPAYERLRKSAARVHLGGLTVLVASI